MAKRAIQLNFLSIFKKKYLEKTRGTTKGRGINGAELIEPIPSYLKADCEIVQEGKNNTFIVMGRDRPGSRDSGYGGKGDTQTGMIDICAGRMGADAKDINKNGEKLYADPDLRRDAARIYISQKADIDSYFKLSAGKLGNSKAKSAIAIKADDIRIISRQGIKLVTATDPKNSQGGTVKSASGIDLIAGNDDKDMQPLVKGDNLVKCLQDIIHKISILDGTLINYITYQLEFNEGVVNHYHRSPFGAIVTSPDIDVLPFVGPSVANKQFGNTAASLARHKSNLKRLSNNYLKIGSKSYINSRNNHTN